MSSSDGTGFGTVLADFNCDGALAVSPAGPYYEATEENLIRQRYPLTRLLPAIVALETISRLAVVGIAAPLLPWLTLFAAAAALVGALQLWSVPDPRRGIAFIIIAMENYLSQLGAWVTVVQGAIFVVCVMAFRRGMFGELSRLLKRPL